MVPLLIGTIFFGVRRSEHLALQKTLSELKHVKPSSRVEFEGQKQTARSSGPAIDPDFLRDLAGRIFVAEASPGAVTEEKKKELMEQLEQAREQLTDASAAEVLGLIPEGFTFKEHPRDTELGTLVEMILWNLENVNPQSYLEIMGSRNFEPLAFSDKAEALNRTLIKWARRSPDEAYAWYQKALGEKNPIVESEEFQAARLRFLGPIAPAEAIAEILALDLENENDIHEFGDIFRPDNPELEDISKVLAAFDRQSASKQESQRLRRLRHSYIYDISSDLAGHGYQEAHAYMECHFSATDKANFFSQVSSNSNNLQASEAWLDYGMLHASASALGDIVSDWAATDPTTSGQWLSKQEEGPKKEAAVYEYAKAMIKVNPEAAREWAETLPDSKNKKLLLVVINAQR